MKGVILAGGTGSRLYPLTLVTNKHLLPIYNKPMLFYPLETLARAGVTDVLIVVGGKGAGDIVRLVGNGRAFGFRSVVFVFQEDAGGIAHAVALAESFVGNDRFFMILGDNITDADLSTAAQSFMSGRCGARLFLKEVPDPERFGVAVLENKRVVKIVEKPPTPLSHFAVTGIYGFDASIFPKINQIAPSARGELEITDINRLYLQEGNLDAAFLDGWWCDAGTFASLFAAASLVASTEWMKRWEYPVSIDAMGM
jgi:glucose-1-phosphate thymidylyltransferase